MSAVKARSALGRWHGTVYWDHESVCSFRKAGASELFLPAPQWDMPGRGSSEGGGQG